VSRRAAAAAALGLALAGAASGEEPRPAAPVRVALDPLRAAGVSPAFAEAVQDRVCLALGEVPGVEVVCPADVAAAALLARNAALFGECGSDECARRVEAVRRADRRVSGAVERGEAGIVLSLQLSGPGGPGPRVVERLPEDLEKVMARVPAVVRKLFP
jgi:hypothetical protein